MFDTTPEPAWGMLSVDRTVIGRTGRGEQLDGPQRLRRRTRQEDQAGHRVLGDLTLTTILGEDRYGEGVFHQLP
jgi:hypothetical protein